MSVYSRLTINNFDTSKFGSNINLTDKDITQLEQNPKILQSWQINSIASASTGASNFYQNPDATNLNSILSNLNSIKNLTSNYNSFDYSDSAHNLYNVANTAWKSANNMLFHTNHLCGVIPTNDMTKYPDLNNVNSIGKKVLDIVYETDGIQDNSTTLGMLTSTYISDEISANSSIISAGVSTISSNIDIYGNNHTPATFMDTLAGKLTNFITLMDTRRTSDCNYYTTCLSIVQDYYNVSVFSRLTQDQYNQLQKIGTPTLINNLKTSNTQITV